MLHVSPKGWLSTPGLPVDYRGPVDQPFISIPDAWLDQPILLSLAQVVRRDPRAIVLHGASGSLSYGELWAAITRLAGVLAGHPSAPHPVAVVMASCVEWWVAVFACLAAGRVAIPLDIRQPPVRLAELLSLTGAGLMLTADTTPVSLPDDLPYATFSVTGLLADPGTQAALPDIHLGLDAPAFIICTSGSTGQPKAIVRSQHSELRVAQTNINAMHLGATDRLLSLMSPGGYGGFANLLRVSLAGMSMEICDFAQTGFKGLFTTLEHQPVTVLQAAASALRGIAQLPRAAHALAGLRMILTGGEPLLREDIRLLRRVLPAACHIRSHYGATEGGFLGWFSGTADADAHHPVRAPTGHLAPGEEAMISDDLGRPCPPDVVGELVLRGRYLSLGEWRDGAVMPSRVRPDPAAPGYAIYPTGDLAQYSADGVFVVLGRIDRQVKINGQRVELGEIEAALRQSADVSHAVALATQDGPAVTIHAFVVSSGPVVAELPAQLRQMLRARLPPYMVPARIRVVAQLPLLPSGKIDELALLSG